MFHFGVASMRKFRFVFVPILLILFISFHFLLFIQYFHILIIKFKNILLLEFLAPTEARIGFDRRNCKEIKTYRRFWGSTNTAGKRDLLKVRCDDFCRLEAYFASKCEFLLNYITVCKCCKLIINWFSNLLLYTLSAKLLFLADNMWWIINITKQVSAKDDPTTVLPPPTRSI